MDRDKTIAALKRFTGAAEVRNYPTGEGEGFAVSMGGGHILFVDQDGDARVVPAASIAPAPPQTEG